LAVGFLAVLGREVCHVEGAPEQDGLCQLLHSSQLLLLMQPPVFLLLPPRPHLVLIHPLHQLPLHLLHFVVEPHREKVEAR
jgi:hypothetical protein